MKGLKPATESFVLDDALEMMKINGHRKIASSVVAKSVPKKLRVGDTFKIKLPDGPLTIKIIDMYYDTAKNRTIAVNSFDGKGKHEMEISRLLADLKRSKTV